jgi:hypothetical protein
MAERPYWAFLFDDFINQTEITKLKARLEPLEVAIYERTQELSSTPESDELRSIHSACKKILEIKTHQLGFPPITASDS